MSERNHYLQGGSIQSSLSAYTEDQFAIALQQNANI